MGPVEKAIREDFIPNLFGEPGCYVTDEERELYGLSVRFAGLGLPNPVTQGAECLKTSVSCCKLLTASIKSGRHLVYAEHKTHAKVARTVAQKARADAQNVKVHGWIDDEERRVMERHRLVRGKKAGAWLTCIPNSLNGTELSYEEFQDNLRLRFGFEPLNLPEKCDGCGEKFTVEHALSCAKGGLVLIRHNTSAGEWGNLCGKGHLPSSVSHEPFIKFSGTQAERDARAARLAAEAAAEARGEGGDETARPPADPSIGMMMKGDKGCDNFWKWGTTCIFDSRITQTDAPTYRGKDPAKVLADAESEKKAKYLQACLDRRRHFTPMVYSVDGMAGDEARAAEKKLASALAGKWKREYSEMCGYVRVRMSIAVVRSNTLLLRGQRKDRGIVKRPVHEDGAGVALQQYWRR